MRHCFTLPLAFALLLSACDQPSELPASRIYVLVDMSETWHNDLSKERNRSVLSEVGLGTSRAARSISDELGRPVTIQTRIIGEGSFHREPICDVIYENSLIKLGNEDARRVSSQRNLDEYLGSDCPGLLAQMPPEGMTEITNAIRAVVDEITIDADHRNILILSDFLEEAVPSELPESLESFTILMVYRPLGNEQRNPNGFRERLDQWRSAFEARGAKVDMVPDTAIRREVIADFLTR